MNVHTKWNCLIPILSALVKYYLFQARKRYRGGSGFCARGVQNFARALACAQNLDFSLIIHDFVTARHSHTLLAVSKAKNIFRYVTRNIIIIDSNEVYKYVTVLLSVVVYSPILRG